MSPSTRYVPDRGHFIRIDFDPQAGHEQGGFRPALVLSSATHAGPSGLAVFCPITSRGKGYPFEVPIPPGLAIHGFVLADGLKSLDWSARGVRYVGTAPQSLVEDVCLRIAALLGIKAIP
jgi:mRNA interferase MazF